MPPEIVRATWRKQARTEYRATALTAELALWCVQLGLSPTTITRASRLAADEVDHSTGSFALYQLAGGTDAAVEAPAQLAHTDDPELPLTWRIVAAAADLAIEETLSVPIFARRCELAKVEAAHALCTRILRDEAVHRAFAWDLLDELAALHGQEAMRTYVRSRLPWWLRGLYGLLSQRPGAPRGPEANAWGVLERDEHAAALLEAVQAQVFGRLQRRDWLEPEASLTALSRELPGVDGRPVPPWRAESR